MAIKHEVQQGECATTIAARYGIHDAKVLEDHPDNQALFEGRPNRNVLAPGDVVVVPDRRLKTEHLETSRVHRFRLKRPVKELRLVLRDANDEPVANLPYVLRLPSIARSGTTGGDGAIAEPVPIGTKRAELEVAGQVLELRLGWLDPMREVDDDGVRGVQARLGNLGYSVGRVDGVLGPRTKLGILVFCYDHDLELSGTITDALRDKLRDVHGS